MGSFLVNDNADSIINYADPGGFFGGLSGKTAAEGTERALQFQMQAAAQQAEQVERARNDLLNLFPQSQQNIKSGFEGALNAFSQGLPQQMSTVQEGNVAAQQQLAASLPQIQNALLGNQVDFTAFQPRQLNIDPNLFNQQLPNFSLQQAPVPEIPTPGDATMGPAPGGGRINLADLFAGGGVNNGAGFNSNNMITLGRA